jgi:hypothetical protein
MAGESNNAARGRTRTALRFVTDPVAKPGGKPSMRWPRQTVRERVRDPPRRWFNSGTCIYAGLAAAIAQRFQL